MVEVTGCLRCLGAHALFPALKQAFDAGLVLHQERIVVDWSPGNVPGLPTIWAQRPATKDEVDTAFSAPPTAH